jgi:hypothetical protein
MPSLRLCKIPHTRHPDTACAIVTGVRVTYGAARQVEEMQSKLRNQLGAATEEGSPGTRTELTEYRGSGYAARHES